MLRGWLAEDSPVRSGNASAGDLAEKLAGLGLGQGWPDHPEKVDEYARSLSGWFGDDAASEATFASLTQSSGDADALINWLLQWVEVWLHGDSGSEGSSAQGEGGQEPKGQLNPNSDGTPGTQYYRVDGAGTYLYAASEDSGEWLTYEQRQAAAHSDLEAQFKADLPDPEQLAEKIVMDVGAVVGQMIAENPALAEVDANTLAAWIAEDVRSALNELGESGWEVK